MRAIRYLYDVPMPNQYSATIQILKTGRAIAGLGRNFAFAARASRSPSAQLLNDLGLSAHPHLTLEPAFARGTAARYAPGLAARWSFFRRPPGHDGAAVLTRGDTGFLVAPAMARRRRGPFVYEMHRLAYLARAEQQIGRRLGAGDCLPLVAQRLRRVEASTISKADALIFLTEEVAQAVRQSFGVSVPSIVAPSGVDVLQVPIDAPKDIDMVYVGKLERRKGVDLALDALSRLPGRRLRIIGDGGGIGWARGIAQRLGVADRVEFVGRLPHSQVAASLASARVGLCPLPEDVDSISQRFTSPLKLLEMMAVGLPLVATDLPSVRAVCTDGQNALLAPPASPQMIAAAVARLLEDQDLAVRLGVAARRRAADFSWEARARRIVDLVDSLEPPQG